MSNIRLRRGDTILGLYNDMYPDLSEREKRKLLEKWEKENFTDPNRVQAGATYAFPQSNYGEQLKLRGEMEPRVTASDLLDLNNVRNRFITGGEGTVNSLLIAQGRKGSFKMSSGGLTHAQAKSIAKMSDDEVIAQIIELQNLAEDLDSIPAYKEWYRSMELPAAYYDKAEQAFIDQQNALRAEKKFPGEVTLQQQAIAKGKRRKIIRDGMEVPQVQDKNGTWVDDPTQQEYPRFQEKIETYSDANGRRRYLDGPNVGRLVSEVEGLPMVEKEYAPTEPRIMDDKNGRKRYVDTRLLVFPDVTVDPTTKTDVNGRLRYTSGTNAGDLVFTDEGKAIAKEYAPTEPKTSKNKNGRLVYTTGDKAGELLFPDLALDPTTKTDINGRLRFVGGNKDGQFVFGGAEGVSKEYAPKDPSTKKAADGYLYFETGPNIGKRVFPNVTIEPKTHTDVNGRLRYSEGTDKGKFVFDEKVPKEYKPTEATTSQRDFQYWLQLRKEGGHIDTAESKAALWQKFRETKQSEVGGYSSADVSALSRKKVSFLNTASLTGRMLRQLANKDVLIGGISSLVQGWENITGQFEQIASTLGETDLLDHTMWDWGRADLSGALKSNITALAYSLARAAEESGGRLSDRDVQAQIDRLSNGLQSKSSMARALVEVHNVVVDQMANLYQESRDRGLLGTEKEWEQFLLEAGTGTLLVRTNPNNPLEKGMGYYVTVTQEDGTKNRIFRTISRWKDE